MDLWRESMEDRLKEIAREYGFEAVIIPSQTIPINPQFRKYCQENICGNYNANYSCPPACGSVQAMHEKILAQDRAMIISKKWPIDSYEDKAGMRRAKEITNAEILEIMDKARDLGLEGFCAGYSGCNLCGQCLQAKGLACPHPDKRIGCLSSYCVDVARLAQICNLEFDWQEDTIYLFGMIAYSLKQA